MSSINFDNPYLILLALPIVALVLVPFFIAVRKDNANGHNIASCVIHCVMALLIAFTAAGTSVVTTVTETDVYVLADVSYSASKNLDAVDGYIADLGKSLPAHSRMGVICFGKDYQLLTKLGERVRSVKEADVDDTATDIVGALDYAGSLFRDGVVKRIVVITDGKQTDGSDANALKRQVDALADKRVHVDAIYLDDNIKEDTPEVQLSGVQYVKTASLDREEKAVVNVRCNSPEKNADGSYYETEAVLTLYKDGEECARKTAYLTRGSNEVNFALDTSEEKTFDYEVRVSAEADTNTHNNTYKFSQQVSGSVKILLVTDKYDDYAEISARYGDERVSLYGISAEIEPFVTVPELPCTLEDLCLYDQIILADVDLVKIKNYQLFLSSLDTAVSLFGKSLITVGNVYVQSYDNGELKSLGNMLPVKFGGNDDDPKLFTLVIDTSRSMEWLYKLDRAKAAALKIIDMLSDDDVVGIVQFSGNHYTVHNPSPLSVDRENIIEKINSLTVMQGTNIGGGLSAAQEICKNASYSEKRVMLISDGLNLSETDKTPTQIANEMTRYDIYTSTLDVGNGASLDTSGADLLNAVATAGGGSYMDISSDDDFEKVISNQLHQEVASEISGASRIHVQRRTDAVLSGIDSSVWQQSSLGVHGFVNAAIKSSADTVLSVDKEKKTLAGYTTVDAPLYAHWNYGNGKVAAFTSSFTALNENGVSIRSWNENLKNTFFGNVAETNAPDEKVNTPFLFDVATEEGYSVVTLTPAVVRADANTQITVTLPDGKTQKGALAFGSSSFTYRFVMPAEGKYEVAVEYEYAGRTFSASRTVYLSYSGEYDSFTLYDAATLHKMLGANGTVSEDGKLQLVNDPDEIGVYNLSLTMPLLIACVVLFVVDIAVRKLKWEDIKGLFKRTGK